MCDPITQRYLWPLSVAREFVVGRGVGGVGGNESAKLAAGQRLSDQECVASPDSESRVCSGRIHAAPWAAPRERYKLTATGSSRPSCPGTASAPARRPSCPR